MFPHEGLRVLLGSLALGLGNTLPPHFLPHRNGVGGGLGTGCGVGYGWPLVSPGKAPVRDQIGGKGQEVRVLINGVLRGWRGTWGSLAGRDKEAGPA